MFGSAERSHRFGGIFDHDYRDDSELVSGHYACRLLGHRLSGLPGRKVSRDDFNEFRQQYNHGNFKPGAWDDTSLYSGGERFVRHFRAKRAAQRNHRGPLLGGADGAGGAGGDGHDEHQHDAELVGGDGTIEL